MKNSHSQEKSIFIKTICGQYSNKVQAEEAPRLYAHINIFFRLLPWSLLKGVSFYSEQSYNHSPWSPYRQAVHKLLIKGKVFIMQNYKIENAYRFAGGGFETEILSTINSSQLSLRESCEMNFYKSKNNCYTGHLKKGCNHIIERDGRKTYLVSKVKFDKHNFLSLDEGFDIETGQKIWGSDNGYLKFQKIEYM
jgi:CpeT protein